VIEPAAIAAVPVRAEEAWQPVLIGGLIPVLGALAVFGLIYKAVKANPENDPDRDEDPEGPASAEPPEEKPPT
jgi:hypothetical protein